MIIASIDIGTNTIILLVAKVDSKSKKIIPIYNEQRIPRIGKNLIEGRPIEKNKIEELFKILKDYNKIINQYDSERKFVTATNALRIASNGKEILENVKTKFNFEAEIVSGNKEAKLSFLGAIADEKSNENYIVIDIGGGSTEIIYGNKKEILFSKSFRIGVVSGTEKFIKNNPPDKNEMEKLKTELEKIFSELKKRKFKFKNAIAIAGTPTTLGAIKLNLNKFDEDKLEGMFLTRKEIDEMIDEISKMNSEEIMLKYKTVVKGREDVIFAGALILCYLMKVLNVDKVKVSTKGIRYGRIVNELFVK